MRRFAILISSVCLASCGGPQGQFERGCQTLVKRDRDATAAQRDAFCTCLREETASLTPAEKRAYGRLMAEAETGQILRERLGEMSEEGELTASGVKTFLSAAKSCTLSFALR